MIPGGRKPQFYTRAQHRLLMLMERSGLDSGVCDEIMRRECPWLPGWYESLMQQEMVTPLERLTEKECEQVARAVRRLLRRMGRKLLPYQKVQENQE